MSYRKRFFIPLFVLSLLIPPVSARAYDEDGRFYFETLFEALNRDVVEENTQFAGENFPETTTSATAWREDARRTSHTTQAIRD